LGIGFEAVVRTALELQIVEVEIARERRGDVDDACRGAGCEHSEQLTSQQKIAEHVGGERELDAVDARLALALCDAGIVDEHIETRLRLPVCAGEVANRTLARGIDLQYGNGLCPAQAADLVGRLLPSREVAAA
jgi:hypothetical protein